MKKIRLFLFCILISACTVLLLASCTKEDKVSSVYLKDYDPEGVIETVVGVFDYDAHTLVVSYDSGRTEEIALREEMIAPADLFKLYNEGEHDVTVTYGAQKFVFKVSVKRSTFTALSFPENNVFTYDGKPHSVEIDGDLPANAIVTYPAGNSFVNAGTYDVVAIVSCEGYVSVKLSTMVRIERAVYDMSDVKFEAKEFVYDGKSHSVEISGNLPSGVSKPTYMINDKVTSSATDAGEYTVTAKFLNSDPNYVAIPDMQTTLTITPAEYIVSGVNIVFKNENGRVIEDEAKVYDTLAVVVDLDDYTKLSNKISVKFSVYDSKGNLISTSNKVTNIKNAGTYTVKVEFTHIDSKNYKPIEPIVCEFKIIKATYDMRDVYFDSDVVAYDGKEHQLSVELPTNHPLKASDVSYEYYLNGVLVTDDVGNAVQSVTEAGEYTVKAIFTVNDENYSQIDVMEAILIIEA